MLKTTNIPWNSLIQFTSSGIIVAEYNEIRTAITEQFKKIYGSDIDLSTSSADGIYVETYCMIINNILQSIKQTYANLNIKTASGSFLDILCALTNVYRKQETHSTASLVATLDSSEQTYTTNSLSFVDVNGNVWTSTSTSQMTFVPGVPQTIVVQCEDIGPIRADAGWINKTLALDVVMSVNQEQPANLGSYAETDAQLRARHSQSLGARGKSVLESLVGALLEITGIDDAKVYNNDGLTAIVAKDGTEVQSHCVYTIVRRKENIDVPDSLIGTILYEKMTPGIPTVQTTDFTNGISHTYVYSQEILGSNATDITQNVYWKEAKPISPEIVITITPKQQFASANDYTVNLIADSVIDYCHNLQISEDIDYYSLYDAVRYADPLFRGKTTYNIVSITIDGEPANFTNPDTYFNYESIKFSKVGSNIIITLGDVLSREFEFEYVDNVMDVSTQFMYAWCWNDNIAGEEFIKVDIFESTSGSGHYGLVTIPEQYNKFLLVVSNSEEISWDTVIKQTSDITIDNTRFYWTDSLNWYDKQSIMMLMNEPTTLNENGTSTHITIPTPFLTQM